MQSTELLYDRGIDLRASRFSGQGAHLKSSTHKQVVADRKRSALFAFLLNRGAKPRFSLHGRSPRRQGSPHAAYRGADAADDWIE